MFSRYQAEAQERRGVSRHAFGSAAFNRAFARGWLAFGYAFLYVPIVALVVYSFNDSPVANVWRGFTLRWYAALVDDRELLAGLALSLKVAFTTACASVVLGTLAAFALSAIGASSAAPCSPAWSPRRWSCPRSSSACRCS